jgi:Antitoxin VbhA
MQDNNTGLLDTEEKRRAAFIAANASNELEGFKLSTADRLRFESMIKGEISMPALLAEFKNEDFSN